MNEGRTPQNFAYVLACGDPKIRVELTRIFDARFGPNCYFWLPELWGVKDLASPDAGIDTEKLFSKMEKAGKVHPFGLVVLVNHSDCAAYRLAGRSFADHREEEGFHVEQLEVAKKVMRQFFPQMAVECHYFLKNEQRMAW